MNNLLLIAVAMAGFGVVLILFNLLKKGAKFAAKLPTNFLAFFLVFSILGLSGFLLNGRIADRPILIGLLVLLISLSGGIIVTYNLFEKWEWSIAASFRKKIVYLLGLTLFSMLVFTLVFIPCEHRGLPDTLWQNDIVWWLAGLIPILLLPLILKQAHTLWNEIPRLKQVIPIYNLPLGSSPPFVEAGGASINFLFIIPLEHESEEVVKSNVSFPRNRTLGEAFHYKLHEHNIVKRFAKKIVLAEDNKKSKIYGWSFYQEKSIWWGFINRRNYFDPSLNIVGTISKGATVLVERVKIWEE